MSSTHPVPISLRWERFAPGPVRQVVVAKAKPAPVPGRGRGRPKKRDASEMDGVFEGDGVQTQVALPSVTVEERKSAVVVEEEPAEERPPIPTRATFAGRCNGVDFQERRRAYYEQVPHSFWKDRFERVYWLKCSASETIDEAMGLFLEEIGVKRRSPLPSTRASRPKAAAQPGKKAKAKPKTHGRGRGRGSTR